MSGKKGKKLASMSMIPTYPLFKLAEVYGIGAEKYAPFNWAKGGIPYSSLYDALIRHAAQWNGGEDIDPENGQLHLASVAWMAFALIELSRTHPEDDDRKYKVLNEQPLSVSSAVTNPEIFEDGKLKNTWPVEDPVLEAQMLLEINDHRAKVGAKPLAPPANPSNGGS